VNCSEPSLRQLIVRYFFYDWLFKDASRGTMLERAAAWRHNTSQRKWLPLYMMRWTYTCLAGFFTGSCLEVGCNVTLPAVPFYSLASVAVAVLAVTFASWVMLGRAD
jgi:hypothetical protein